MYTPPKKKVTKSTTKQALASAAIAAASYKGFNHDAKYSEGEHTDTDRDQEAEASMLVDKWWRARMDPTLGFSPIDVDEQDVTVLHAVDKVSGSCKAIGHCIINATPKQAFGYYTASRKFATGGAEVIEASYTASLELLAVAADKETLCRRFYLKKKKLARLFSLEEFEHSFLPQPGVVDTFVLRSSSGEVTDLCSYILAPMTLTHSRKHKNMLVAYSYYNVASTVSLVDLVGSALVLARNRGADVYNMMDVMDNAEVFKPLLFDEGTGSLSYYLYNYLCPAIVPDDVGLVFI